MGSIDFHSVQDPECHQKLMGCISTTTCELAQSAPGSLWLTGLSLTPSLTARHSSDVPSPKPKRLENFPSDSSPSSLLMTRSSPSPGLSTGLSLRKARLQDLFLPTPSPRPCATWCMTPTTTCSRSCRSSTSGVARSSRRRRRNTSTRLYLLSCPLLSRCSERNSTSVETLSPTATSPCTTSWTSSDWWSPRP